MTDLPQLQEALVVAARRRNRRARAGSSLVGLAALAAVVVAAATALDGSEGELEFSATPAPPPSVSTARAYADRFAVFRDPSQPTCNAALDAGPGSRNYLVHRQGRIRVCISVGQTICTNTYVIGGGWSGGCDGPAEQRKFAEGRFGVSSVRSDGQRGRRGGAGAAGDLIYAVVPDGTRDATITYRDGTIEPVPIEDNFLGVVVDKPAAKVTWTTPDGERFTSRP